MAWSDKIVEDFSNRRIPIKSDSEKFIYFFFLQLTKLKGFFFFIHKSTISVNLPDALEKTPN